MTTWTASDRVVAACAAICVLLGVFVAPVAAGSVSIPIAVGGLLVAMLVRTRRRRARRSR